MIRMMFCLCLNRLLLFHLLGLTFGNLLVPDFNHLLSVLVGFDVSLLAGSFGWVEVRCTVKFHSNEATEISHMTLETASSKLLAPCCTSKSLDDSARFHLLLEEFAVDAMVNLDGEWSECKTFETDDLTRDFCE